MFLLVNYKMHQQRFPLWRGFRKKVILRIADRYAARTRGCLGPGFLQVVHLVSPNSLCAVWERFRTVSVKS
jgi:hypothetical protein